MTLVLVLGDKSFEMLFFKEKHLIRSSRNPSLLISRRFRTVHASTDNKITKRINLFMFKIRAKERRYY